METSASSKTMNNPANSKPMANNEFQGIETTMRERTMGTPTIRNAAAGKKFLKGCAVCTAFLALTLATPRAHAATASELNASAAEEQGKQRAGDRVVVTLSDPSRPSLVKVSLITGGITVKAHEGKDIIVEAHARKDDDSDEDRPGPKRLVIASTGLNVEEENNQVNIGTDSPNRAIDLV